MKLYYILLFPFLCLLKAARCESVIADTGMMEQLAEAKAGFQESRKVRTAVHNNQFEDVLVYVMLTTKSGYWPSRPMVGSSMPTEPEEPFTSVILRHLPEIKLTAKLLDTHASRGLLAAALRKRLVQARNPYINSLPVPQIPVDPREQYPSWAELVGGFKVDYEEFKKAVEFLHSIAPDAPDYALIPTDKPNLATPPVNSPPEGAPPNRSATVPNSPKTGSGPLSTSRNLPEAPQSQIWGSSAVLYAVLTTAVLALLWCLLKKRLS